MRILVITYLLILTIFESYSQPVSGLLFTFEIYDSCSIQLDYDKFKSSYNVITCDNKFDMTGEYWGSSKQRVYKDSTKTFQIWNSSSIYGDFCQKIIFKTDTMVIYIRNAHKWTTLCHVDTLFIKPGYYLLEPGHHKSIDFDNARIAYYNNILELYLRLSEYHRADDTYYAVQELKKLKKLYGIDIDDNKPIKSASMK